MVWAFVKRILAGAPDAQRHIAAGVHLPSKLRNQEDVAGRVSELVALYSGAGASPALLLCDKYPADALAYRVVAPDLTATDLTYGELRQQSEKLAAGFAGLGIRAGDRVATLMGKSAEFLVTLLAIWRIGAVHVPLFTAFAPSAIALRLSVQIPAHRGQRSGDRGQFLTNVQA